VSPAFEAAMQTMPPMVIARAPKAGAVQPLTRKIAAVAMRVAMVMPETGEALEPTMPTIRAETVTKRKPKSTTRKEAARLAKAPTWAPGTGLNSRKTQSRRTRRTEPPRTTDQGRSRSVLEFVSVPGCMGREADPSAPLRSGRDDTLFVRSEASAVPEFFLPMERKPSMRAATMVGAVRRRVMSPLQATAPAPIGRT
jgi:hypothetical protein